tara:strand:+ start:12620 stop:13519 length:900 start_codon:yes stop_codon:yes gene_type:complete
MTDFAAPAPHALSGKHNMASDAFQALRTARAEGRVDTDKVSFADLIDTVNPLQHIPVVSTLYRDLTGDKISAQARMAGGALYGGPIGLVASMVDSAIKTVTGNDFGGHVIATLFGSDEAPKGTGETTKLAANTPQANGKDADLITASLAATPALPVSAPKQPERLPELLSASAGAAALPKSATPPKPLPELSPEAFGALLNSFANPKAAEAANAGLAAKLAVEPAPGTASDKTATLTAEAAPAPLPRTPATPVASAVTRPAGTPVNLFSDVQSGLDKLEALKAANAKSLSLNATSATGF